MKKILSSLKSFTKASKGFTLIELLIVIAILGILTVAVLSAINPVEQINRGRDTGGKSDSEQLLSAMQRFNATDGYYVWQTAPTDPTAVAWTAVSASVPTDGTTAILTKLGPTGNNELLPAFITRITGTGYNKLYMYNHGDQGDSTYVCFPPQSQQIEKEAVARCAAAPETSHPQLVLELLTTSSVSHNDVSYRNPNFFDRAFFWFISWSGNL